MRVVLLAFMFFQIECNFLVGILIIAWTMTHNMQTSQMNLINHLLVPAVQPALSFIFMWNFLSLKDKFFWAGGCIKSKELKSFSLMKFKEEHKKFH